MSLPSVFPYDAINPMTAKEQTFNNIDDVYNVLIECFDRCVKNALFQDKNAFKKGFEGFKRFKEAISTILDLPSLA